MLKKSVIFLFCVFPVLAIAQDKLGHTNSKEIMMAMPEVKTVEKTLDELQTQWENELGQMSEEYYTKIKEFQDKQATMPESIKSARQSEIIELEQRITTVRQTATADLQQKHQELLAPIVEKVRKAINEVGTENNFTYIFDLDAQSIIYQSPKANDVTDLVKKKLGITK